MLKNCPHCGAANRERANDCYVCESPLPEMLPAEPEPLEDARDVAGDLASDILENIPESASAESVAASAARPATVTEFRPSASKASVALAEEPHSDGREADGSPPALSEPEWKREVASKLEQYRSRRQRGELDSQNALPFADQAQPAAAPWPHPRESLRLSARSRPQPADPLAIAAQPELDFEALSHAPQPTNRLVPVAPLRLRLRAGLLDAGFLVITFGGFLLLFNYLGNPLTFGKVEVAVYTVALFLIYGLYFTLFTAFSAATPGMLIRGLYPVSFDGHPPTPQQMLWRSFGYLVSAATGLLGFLWALWDEDHLTWQDRISQTYLTQFPGELFPAGASASSSFSSPSDHSSQSFTL